jgi:hypothetical protein
MAMIRFIFNLAPLKTDQLRDKTIVGQDEISVLESISFLLQLMTMTGYMFFRWHLRQTTSVRDTTIQHRLFLTICDIATKRQAR